MWFSEDGRNMGREVLVAHRPSRFQGGWLNDVDRAFRPVGLTICHAHTTPATVERVERGGLAAAVLIADRSQIDGLALLRIIRSFDLELPCWLITDSPTRPTLEAAFALRATCVMDHPRTAGDLALAVLRVLTV